MIADALREEVQTLLDQPVADIRSVSGGSINQSAKITSESGERYFLKWNDSAAADMFPKEEGSVNCNQPKAGWSFRRH